MKKCDLCSKPDLRELVDGAQKLTGQWANMCMACHAKWGVGLGTGRGQHYIWNLLGARYVKVDG